MISWVWWYVKCDCRCFKLHLNSRVLKYTWMVLYILIRCFWFPQWMSWRPYRSSGRWSSHGVPTWGTALLWSTRWSHPTTLLTSATSVSPGEVASGVFRQAPRATFPLLSPMHFSQIFRKINNCVLVAICVCIFFRLMFSLEDLLEVNSVSVFRIRLQCGLNSIFDLLSSARPKPKRDGARPKLP